MLRNFMLYGNPMYVVGASDMSNPRIPNYSMLTYFKEQPFFEWMAHHTLGLMGFSGYCLTAENKEVLDQLCRGVKMTAMNDGHALWILMLVLGLVGLVLFVHLSRRLIKPGNLASPEPERRSLQEWLQQHIQNSPRLQWGLGIAAVLLAVAFYAYFYRHGFRLSQDRISLVILMVFGVLGASAIAGLATVFLGKNAEFRLMSYGIIFAALFTFLLFKQSANVYAHEGALRGVQGRYLFPFYPLILVGVGLAFKATPKGAWLLTLCTLGLLLMHLLAYADFFMPFYQSVRLS
jgi:hypothetical protein